MDEENELIKAWGKFSLTSDEDSTIIRAPRLSLDSFSKNSSLCLIGKLVCQRSIPSEAILRAFTPVWNVENSLTIKGELGPLTKITSLLGRKKWRLMLT